MLADHTQTAIAELVERLATAGRDDPTIAARLDISVSRVRALRKAFDIPAGERRWLPVRTTSEGGDRDGA